MLGKPPQAIVTFDGSNSFDSDGTIVRYEWNFGDGTAPGVGQRVTHPYTSRGGYVVTLTIEDDRGAISQDMAEVTIVEPAPPSAN
jgi:PKD repeat protein